MKKYIVILLVSIVSVRTSAQQDEIQQLLLDIEKLVQFKQILSDLKKGFAILSDGYTTIKNISKGNFDLHQTFLDGLLQVSPAVQKYKRVADIISYQLRIVKEYKQAFSRFQQDQNFTAAEIDYMGKVYSNLFNQSLKNLDDLGNLLAPGKLRMSDDERLQSIDRIFSSIEDQYAFLRDFNSSTALLSFERSKDKQDVDVSRKLYNIK